MPGLSGGDLAVRLETVRPETKVPFMSGYADRSDMPQADPGRLLRKPFAPATLAERVREILHP
ncbi:MAG: hypothetical protein HYR60_09845 [Acidobacteria bacterium]|nr:hypothetical protein [Acidobacteriota bacterium]